MDRLRQLWTRINAQLSELTVSQRLAIGLCAALAAVSLLWLMQWSVTPERVSLVSYDFTYDDLNAAEQSLKQNGITYETHGTRIYVRPSDRHNALRLVYGAGALPEGSLFDMEAVITNSNPFQSPEARAYAETFAKGNELAKIIATSPFVTKASVILNPVTKRRLGGITDVPTASVSLTLLPGKELTHEVVEGFAKLVAGSVAGLKPHHVYITDARTGRSHSLPHPDDAASFDFLSMIKQREQHYRSKILDKLADIPGVLVAVTVELDMSRRVTKNVKHDQPQVKLDTRSESTQSSAQQPSEPGVQANLGQALTIGGQGQSNTTDESTTEHFEPKISQTETIEQWPFSTKKVTATVGIPRSFILGVFKAQYPQVTEDPANDDPAFVTVRDAQTSRVRASVERIVMARHSDDVEVDVYPDMEWSTEGGSWSRTPGGVMLSQQRTEALDAVTLVRSYAPQVGLATLALVSLFMMMRIVRKSSDIVEARRLDGVEATNPQEEEILKVGPRAIGQAEASESLLAGKEVDPDTLRYQELGQEVSKLVDSDPAGAANLIRRWIEVHQ